MKNMEKTNENVEIPINEIEKASYKSQQLKEYENNPFIEALPPIFTEEDVLDHFMVNPRISQQDKAGEVNIRYHVLKRIKSFVQPLPIHFEVERRLSTLIRRGYLARNPLNKTFLERIRLLHELREDEKQAHKYIEDRLNYIRSTADSLSIIGISGIGKTTAIERLLLMYPQVIKHETYKNQMFNRTQITWLKIDCPYDGSLSTLCKSFFKAIDDILGTHYLEKFGYFNRITSTMLLYMTSLASLYGIGVLVIDEIQHLANSKNEQEEMLNFFVTLSNTVGVPTVLIGTSKAQQLFKGNFRQARRAASDGSIFWDRMEKDSEEWELFLETLWNIQCLKEHTELTEELKTVFYEECQGITAVAVNLFILAQEQVLFDDNNVQEKITIDVLRKTSKVDLKIIQPMLKAIRNNDFKAMYKFEDLMINLDELMINHKKNITYEGRVKAAMKERLNTLEYKREDKIKNLCIELTALGIFTALNPKDIRKIVIDVVDNNPSDVKENEIKLEIIQRAMEMNQKKYNETPNKECKGSKLSLLVIRDTALKNKKHPYDYLDKNGYISNPLIEFY